MEQDKLDHEYDSFLRHIGSHLEEERKRRGVSRRHLGEVLGKNPTVIARVEKSGGRRTSLKSIFEVARSIGVSLGEIISRSEFDLGYLTKGKKPDERIQSICQRLEALSDEEQEWFIRTFESLLSRSKPGGEDLSNGKLKKPTDRTDSRGDMVINLGS